MYSSAEIGEILAAVRGDGVYALAKVAQTKGSSYARPGARMIIRPDGSTVGAISGGCLDQDLVEHAKNVFTTGKPAVVNYDTSGDSDQLFGTGLGCGGSIDVLLTREGQGEPTSPPLDELAVVRTVFEKRSSGILATVVRTPEAARDLLARRLWWTPGGEVQTDLEDGTARAELIELAERHWLAPTSGCVCVQEPGSGLEILVETIFPPQRLYVVGANNDAVPLVRLAVELGFSVVVVDHRQELLTRERFPAAAELKTVVEPGVFAGQCEAGAAAVVMTHHFARDLAWLAVLLRAPLAYLGLLGARHRASRILEALRSDGHRFAPDELAMLHSPAGLDIGAEGPREIALSILAEIKAVLARRAGGPLRERANAIHEGRGADSHSVRNTAVCPR